MNRRFQVLRRAISSHSGEGRMVGDAFEAREKAIDSIQPLPAIKPERFVERAEERESERKKNADG